MKFIFVAKTFFLSFFWRQMAGSWVFQITGLTRHYPGLRYILSSHWGPMRSLQKEISSFELQPSHQTKQDPSIFPSTQCCWQQRKARRENMAKSQRWARSWEGHTITLWLLHEQSHPLFISAMAVGSTEALSYRNAEITSENKHEQ